MAANWKMYKNPDQTRAFFHDFLPLVAGHTRDEIVVCPPYIDLYVAIEATKGSNVAIGAQDLYWEKEGAYTGEICPAMLLDIGCTHVIIGHSERRQYFGETDDIVNFKLKAALEGGLQFEVHDVVSLCNPSSIRVCEERGCSRYRPAWRDETPPGVSAFPVQVLRPMAIAEPLVASMAT